jgi:hypothetical protein
MIKQRKKDFISPFFPKVSPHQLLFSGIQLREIMEKRVDSQVICPWAGFGKGPAICCKVQQ